MQVLVVEDGRGHADEVRDLLDAAAPGEFVVSSVASPAEAVGRLLGVDRPALGCILLGLPPGPGDLATLEQVRTAALGAAVVVHGRDSDDALALAAVEAGVQDVVARGEADGRALARALRHAAVRGRREAALVRRALHDPLTGLPNRSLFSDRLHQALNRVVRTRTWLAVMFVDLDGFKAVNDTRGHAAGDALLVEVAGRLVGALRGGDTAARLGGDEFGVLCEDVAGEEEARRIAERLLGGLPAHASVGIALTADGTDDPSTLLHAADEAMYAVKRRGGNGLAVARG